MRKPVQKLLPLFLAIPIFVVVYLQSAENRMHAAEERLYAEEGYLFEVLENPVYRKTWDRLIATQQNIDDWLADYSKTRNGPATPANKVQLDGEDYQLNFVCKAHDCGDNHFVVLFNADGTQAWGVLRRTHQEDLFFGAPDAARIELLLKEAGE